MFVHSSQSTRYGITFTLLARYANPYHYTRQSPVDRRRAMTRVSYYCRRFSGVVVRAHCTASSSRTSYVHENDKIDFAMSKCQKNRRRPELRRCQAVVSSVASATRQQQQRRCASSISSKISMTAEEAGRKASQLALEAMEQKNRNHVVDNHSDDHNRNSQGSDNGNIIAKTSVATILSHAGIEICHEGSIEMVGTSKNFPMSPPLHTATTYTRPPDGIYKDG